MRITRLHLRNYRVYEEPLDLEIPPGLVGIYGPNGGGKSTIVESIRWTLFGKSRTANDEIRTAGLKADCVSEVEFEHEGHLYLVRRTISGAGSAVKAQAHSDGYQVAEGVRDTARYVHSILGMDDAAFRASVFAEQKQLAAFSDQPPAERRKLVLQLLGITPLDGARDLARKDSRAAAATYERLRDMLPDLSRVKAELQEAVSLATALEWKASELDTALETARVHFEAALRTADRLEGVRQEYDRIVAEGHAVKAEYNRALAAGTKLADELAGLEAAAARLASLQAEAEGWRDAEARLRRVEAVVAARAAVAVLPPPEDPPTPDEEGYEAARAELDGARAEVARVQAVLDAARSARERAGAAVERSGDLTGEGDCPLCGQSLGDAFEAVQAHRAAELAAAEGALVEAELDRRRAGFAASLAAEAANALLIDLRLARDAWKAYESTRARRSEAEAALARAEAAHGEEVAEGFVTALAAEVDRRRQAADECQRIAGRLERRVTAKAELDVERAAADESKGRLDNLRAKLTGLEFQPEAVRQALDQRDRLRAAADEAALAAGQARVAAVQARAKADAEARRLAEALAQHDKLAGLGDDARHLSRLADMLNAFRNELVASVGPRLSEKAGALFAELTDHEYDELIVNPETYEIQLRDAGLLYGMTRFSGSETDLANLALRVAVSEQVQFQAGGAVGLLVLDEVFGPLDDERKERMLLALERLKNRFRQVLVVTHDNAIKEQLPNAIEVVKLPGRRATAHLLNN
ncbi:MAG: repair protein SbcC/Rad50 [Actinomycetota bacterium]|jgi:DNA repair exonuclease SbcCD ATPase subunit|nr:repair protein SbcC/Rad50 [Actinomycetota bacterium]